MTLPVQYNAISMGDVRTELNKSSGSISLNDPDVRVLFQVNTISGTVISLHDGHGKSNIMPPSNVVTSNITQTTATVQWKPYQSISIDGQVDNYQVIVYKLSDMTVVFNSGLLSISTSSSNITGLIASADHSSTKNFQVDVSAKNVSATKTTSVNLLTLENVPLKPSLPVATAISATQISVNATSTYATTYYVYKDGSTTPFVTSEMPYIDTVGVYTVHTYTVKGHSTGGDGPMSDVSVAERSFPEYPVVVTDVVLTPDINSILVSWTLAVTTPTRTADNYKVYVYLTSNMTEVYNSGDTLLGPTVTSITTSSTLLGYTNYTIRIYTYNRAGSIFVDNTVTTLPDINPDPLTGSLVTVVNQEPGANDVVSAQVSISLFQPNYNSPGIAISSSTGSFQAGTSVLTTGWVTSATVVPDSSGNIVFQARRNASPNESTTVTSTYTIGGGSRTFSVTTRDPNPPTGVSAVGGSGTATISWTNLGYTYIVTADTGQTKTVSNVGSVVLGDSPSTRLGGNRTFYVYAKNELNGTSTPSSTTAYVIPMPVITYNVDTTSITEASQMCNFYISVDNIPDGTVYDWSLTGIQTADIASMTATNSSGYVSITTALSGSVTVTGSIAGVKFVTVQDYVTEGDETVSFSITGSPAVDFANSPKSVVIRDTSLSRITYYNTYWYQLTYASGSYQVSKNTNTAYQQGYAMQQWTDRYNDILKLTYSLLYKSTLYDYNASTTVPTYGLVPYVSTQGWTATWWNTTNGNWTASAWITSYTSWSNAIVGYTQQPYVYQVATQTSYFTFFNTPDQTHSVWQTNWISYVNTAPITSTSSTVYWSTSYNSQYVQNTNALTQWNTS